MKRVAFTAALLAGCTVGPDYRPPATAVPQHYLEPADGGLSSAELAHWWRSFSDPELSSLVERAVALNLDVQTAAARIREARAREVYPPLKRPSSAAVKPGCRDKATCKARASRGSHAAPPAVPRLKSARRPGKRRGTSEAMECASHR